MEIIDTKTNGQSKMERIRILTLIPLMYALDTFFHLPKMNLERIKSVAMADPTASKIAS